MSWGNHVGSDKVVPIIMISLISAVVAAILSFWSNPLGGDKVVPIIMISLISGVVAAILSFWGNHLGGDKRNHLIIAEVVTPTSIVKMFLPESGWSAPLRQELHEQDSTLQWGVLRAIAGDVSLPGVGGTYKKHSDAQVSMYSNLSNVMDVPDIYGFLAWSWLINSWQAGATTAVVIRWFHLSWPRESRRWLPPFGALGRRGCSPSLRPKVGLELGFALWPRLERDFDPGHVWALAQSVLDG